MTNQHDIDLILVQAYAKFMDIASKNPSRTSEYVDLSEAFLRYHITIRAGLTNLDTLDDELRRLTGGQ